MSYLRDQLKIGLGFERLFFFFLMFGILCHIVACIWVIIASINVGDDNSYDGTWLESYSDMDASQLYCTSVYWTITTITTVGYGDISGTNTLEKWYCSFIMLVGVISFSFANGSLASILSNLDNHNAQYAEKV